MSDQLKCDRTAGFWPSKCAAILNMVTRLRPPGVFLLNCLRSVCLIGGEQIAYGYGHSPKAQELEKTMIKPLNPPSIAPPFGAYSHGVKAPSGQLVLTSGQLGLDVDGTVPASVYDQAMICFGNIEAILGAAGLGRQHVLRLNAYVTDRAHMQDYMAARDAWLTGLSDLPASTLMIVSGFTRAEFLVEIEATALGG